MADFKLCMSKHFVYIYKARSIAEALQAPRGERVEIDGRNVVGIFRRGKTVITPEYTEQKLVLLSPDSQGLYWSFSCPVAFASLLPTDEDHDAWGRFCVNDSGYLLYSGPVDNGASASELALKMLTDNPDWFMEPLASQREDLLKIASSKSC